MTTPSHARTIVPLDVEEDDTLVPPPRVEAPDPLDPPDAIVVRLRRAGLVGEGERVEIVTDAPPPVRERTPPRS